MKLHFCHISRLREPWYDPEAKRGNSKTCEVTPHIFFCPYMITRADLEHQEKWSTASGLSTQQNLWNGLNDGTIDVIASDHASASGIWKNRLISGAPRLVSWGRDHDASYAYGRKKKYDLIKTLHEVTSLNPAGYFLSERSTCTGLWCGFDDRWKGAWNSAGKNWHKESRLDAIQWDGKGYSPE